MVQARGVLRILDVDPHLLVEQEEMKVVQEGRDVLFAEVVVSAASHDESVAHGQEGHLVPEPCTRRVSSGLQC